MDSINNLGQLEILLLVLTFIQKEDSQVTTAQIKIFICKVKINIDFRMIIKEDQKVDQDRDQDQEKDLNQILDQTLDQDKELLVVMTDKLNQCKLKLV